MHWLQRAVEVDPMNADVYSSLAAVYTDNGQDHQAELSYQKVIELRPQNANAYNNLGVFFNKKSK